MPPIPDSLIFSSVRRLSYFHRVFLPAILGLFLAATCSDAQSATLRDFLTRRGYEGINLQLSERNHLIVQGFANGKKILFCVDTGATTAIDLSKAQGWRVLSSNTNEIRGLFGTTGRGSLAVAIDRLQLGALWFTNVTAHALKLHPDKNAPTGSRIRSRADSESDALLGIDFLHLHHALIDCRTKVVYFRAESAEESIRKSVDASLRGSGYSVVDIELPRGIRQVSGKINGKPVNFMLDTGTFSSCIDINHVANLGIDNSQFDYRAGGIGEGSSTVGVAKLKSLEIGGYRTGNIRFAVMDLSYVNEGETDESLIIHGLLGPEVLDRAEAIIDCDNWKLYLKSGPDVKNR